MQYLQTNFGYPPIKSNSQEEINLLFFQMYGRLAELNHVKISLHLTLIIIRKSKRLNQLGTNFLWLNLHFPRESQKWKNIVWEKIRPLYIVLCKSSNLNRKSATFWVLRQNNCNTLKARHATRGGGKVARLS